MIIELLALIGFCISLYGFSIEQKLKKNPNYKPLCDISDAASCTKPIRSPLGKLFGISNTIVGMLFYPAIAFLAWAGWYQLLVLCMIGASAISLYLAYVLFFQIKTFCLICVVTYFLNGALLVASILHVI
jgi:vitamin-K-epoxide reductase (warfarin-sensitive)